MHTNDEIIYAVLRHTIFPIHLQWIWIKFAHNT